MLNCDWVKCQESCNRCRNTNILPSVIPSGDEEEEGEGGGAAEDNVADDINKI